MLRSMTVINHLGDSLTVELENPKTSGFQVAGIDGLGPPKADIFMSNIAAYDGSVFSSARVDSRNIVIRLVYVGDDIEALRHQSYKFFPTKRNVNLIFKNDSREVQISGYVESNEVAIFSKMEGSVISVICPEPWFETIEDILIEQTFSNTDPLFSFEYYSTIGGTDEFEIRYSDAEVSDDKHIEFSMINPISSGTIWYDGDLEVGVTMRLKSLGQPGNITINNADTREQMVISSSIIQRITGSAIKFGDELFITTMQGRKTARLLRDGTYKNVIAAVDKSSNWFKLSKGANNFVLSTSSGTGDIELSMVSKTLYEGI